VLGFSWRRSRLVLPARPWLWLGGLIWIGYAIARGAGYLPAPPVDARPLPQVTNVAP
jgi:hypothetical protein